MKKFFKKNASTILTYAGGIGVIATSIMAAKAAPKALNILKEAEEEKGEKLTKFETVLTGAPIYIPTALMGIATIACIFGANILNKRTQAALISGYALLDSSYKDYRNKVTEIYGKNADRDVKNEVAKDRYQDVDIEDTDDDGKTLFYDTFSQRYYRVTSEAMVRAEHDINKILNERGAASLNEYYDLLGIPTVDYGEHIGWSSAQMYETYWNSWLHFTKTKVIMDDGLECVIVDFTEPFISFEEY